MPPLLRIEVRKVFQWRRRTTKSLNLLCVSRELIFFPSNFWSLYFRIVGGVEKKQHGKITWLIPDHITPVPFVAMRCKLFNEVGMEAFQALWLWILVTWFGGMGGKKKWTVCRYMVNCKTRRNLCASLWKFKWIWKALILIDCSVFTFQVKRNTEAP